MEKEEYTPKKSKLVRFTAFVMYYIILYNFIDLALKPFYQPLKLLYTWLSN